MAKKIATPPAPSGYMRIWLTRDASRVGVYLDTVDVWLAPPEAITRDDGSRWYRARPGEPLKIATGNGDVPVLWARWTIAQCIRQVGTYPDDDRQVIVSG